MSFDSIGSMQSIESSQSNLTSEISAMSLEDDFKDILESSEEPEIFEGFEKPESKVCSEFPNEAYKDLMLLVTRHKLNNKDENNIICFFNKHSNLTKLPLPKNIATGRALMNNMKFSNLDFCKVLIINHGGKDYYLYHQNLIQY